jgi:hypothetical protein
MFVDGIRRHLRGPRSLPRHTYERAAAEGADVGRRVWLRAAMTTHGTPLTVCLCNERCIRSLCGMQTLERAYPWRCPVRVSRPSKPPTPATQTRETPYPYVRVEGFASAGAGLASETRGLPVRITNHACHAIFHLLQRPGHYKRYCRHAFRTDNKNQYHSLQFWDKDNDDGRPYHYCDYDGYVSYLPDFQDPVLES